MPLQFAAFGHDRTIGNQNVEVVLLGLLIRLPERGAGRQPVVGVQEEYVFTLGHIQSGIASDTRTLVLLPDDMEPGITFFPEFQYLRRVVGGTVIYADDFDLRHLLLHENAGQCLRQIELRIEDRHDDRNLWRVGRRQNKRVAPRPRPESGGIGRVHMPPPEVGVPARGLFPGFLSAGEMHNPHLIPGQGDLLLDAVVAQLHVPARVERRNAALAHEVQGVLIAEPFSRLQHDLKKSVKDRLASEPLQIHDQNARIHVVIPLGKAPPSRPRQILGFRRVDYVFCGGNVRFSRFRSVKLAQVATYGNIHIKIDQLVVGRQNVGNKQSIAGGHRQPVHLLEFGEPGTRQSV